MKSSIKNIALIGCGVIGTGWAIRLLANDKKINIFEPNKSQINFLFSELKRTKKIISKFYNINKVNLNNISIKNSIKEAVENADLIQENTPENLAIKKKIIREISLFTKKKSIIASS